MESVVTSADLQGRIGRISADESGGEGTAAGRRAEAQSEREADAIDREMADIERSISAMDPQWALSAPTQLSSSSDANAPSNEHHAPVLRDRKEEEEETEEEEGAALSSPVHRRNTSSASEGYTSTLKRHVVVSTRPLGRHRKHRRHFSRHRIYAEPPPPVRHHFGTETRSRHARSRGHSAPKVQLGRLLLLVFAAVEIAPEDVPVVERYRKQVLARFRRLQHFRIRATVRSFHSCKTRFSPPSPPSFLLPCLFLLLSLLLVYLIHNE